MLKPSVLTGDENKDRQWEISIPFTGTREQVNTLFTEIINVLEQHPGYPGGAFLSDVNMLIDNELKY